ncbi:MAG: DUF362 domain-containing protein [Candidatus Lokiarchaeota archaeon]|nr:DUF362 domain-containing protein [Candidatus Lokiarchaeota archaeon]
MKSQVHIFKKRQSENDIDFVYNALKTFNAIDYLSGNEKKILIKPNWVCDDLSSSGNVTSTDTLEGVVKYLINNGKTDPSAIFIGDGGQDKYTRRAMELNDVFRLEDYGISVIDLNNDERVEDVKIPNPLALCSVNLSKIAWEADCIISIPSLKTHSIAGTTLSMKNLMGTIMPKGIMHSRLHEKIADLTSLFRAKMKFQLIDAIVGSDGFEIGGNPVRMDLIVVGSDPVAVDSVGSAIIGRNPKYLKIAGKKGLGTADINEINVNGAQINEVYRKFC